MGVSVETPEGMSHKQVALAHCGAVKTTIDDIKAIILSPAVITACLAGMTTVSTREFRVVLTPSTGVVVTIAEPRSKRWRKFQLKSRREHQKTLKEINRRQKRRPASSARPSGSEDGV
ncbi:MAG: hypothetical protein AAAC47_01800 [Pararhizobium sp.]